MTLAKHEQSEGMELRERIAELHDLIALPCWTYREIMRYDDKIKSKATAIKIKERAIKEENGAVKYGSQYAKTDSVLALYGTSRLNEITVLRKLLENEERTS